MPWVKLDARERERDRADCRDGGTERLMYIRERVCIVCVCSESGSCACVCSRETHVRVCIRETDVRVQVQVYFPQRLFSAAVCAQTRPPRSGRGERVILYHEMARPTGPVARLT